MKGTTVPPAVSPEVPTSAAELVIRLEPYPDGGLLEAPTSAAELVIRLEPYTGSINLATALVCIYQRVRDRICSRPRADRRRRRVAGAWPLGHWRSQALNRVGRATDAHPLRHSPAALVDELANQARPLFQVGKELASYLAAGREKLAEQLGRGHQPGPYF